MTDTIVKAEQSPADPTGGAAGTVPPFSARTLYGLRGHWVAFTAAVAGLLGALLAVAVPLLPVHVAETTLTWPQPGTAGSVTAPLVSYAPRSLDATFGCAAIDQLAPRGGLLMATMPATAPDLDRYGFVARVRPAGDGAPARLDVVLRNTSLVSAPLTELGGGCTITVHSDAAGTTATVVGTPIATHIDGDQRPQVVGLFSNLNNAAGTTVSVAVDSRFTVAPTVLKRTASILAFVFTALALLAVHRMDTSGQERSWRRLGRLIPQHWRRCRGVDLAVVATLVLWHFIGATTSDDGYQFGMARTSLVSGYMANYFRYFGVPETPVGTPPYDVLAALSRISIASPWMRLPTLLSGVLIWLAISREVIPRLGVAVRRDRIAVWTGAVAFLAAWLPYDNGLRPEPVVATCLIVAWCLTERAVATRRLLPYLLAVLVAAFSCTAAPSGVVCIAALLAGSRPVWAVALARMRRPKRPRLSPGRVLAVLAPVLAAGLLVLAVAFWREPLSAMFEMRRVHQAALPNDPWYNEYLRYQWLFMPTVDGSIARRFPMVALWLGMLACVFVLLRHGGRIPMVAGGPARRLLGTTLGATLLMMTTPTKWTHQNGVYAGLIPAVAVLTAVAVGPRVLRSPRNRALFAAVVALALSEAFSSVNGWWYVSSFGVPWWDKPPSLHGFSISKALLLVAVLFMLLAGWWHVRGATTDQLRPRARRLLGVRPLSVALALLVLFEVASFAKAAVTQYPAFSLARSNIDAALGQPCGLARDVLVENDPNAGLLAPLTGSAATTFTGNATGFVPNGVGDLNPDDTDSGGSTIASSVTGKAAAGTATATAGAALPFGLSTATTPELGTFGQPGPAQLTTGWYQLPSRRDGILAIAAAGRIRSIDKDGIVTPGVSVELEYGTATGDSGNALGRVTPIDIGPAPAWRNLRVPLSQVPAEANAVRLVVANQNLDPAQWVALTPPRVPQTRTLDQVVGHRAPVLLDWAVGLQFPCQRPFDHHDGVAQVPAWRILPDRLGAHDTNLWEDHNGGGPLGWTQELLQSQVVATYLRDDWRRDWGELQRFTPMDPTAGPAQLVVGDRTRSGMWSPGHIETAW